MKLLFSKFFILLNIFLSTFLYTTGTYAQIPNSGSIQQNIENGFQRIPNIPSQERSLPLPNETPVPDDIHFSVKKIIFSGNTLLSNDQINLVINDYLQKVISFNQLQVLTFSIENQYRLSGGLARVLIPPQRILDETLYIQIEESKWGEVLIDNQYLHLNPQKVIDTISFLQIPGKLIDLKQLERSILLTGDLPGIGINASLRKSSTPLTTDLVANITEVNPGYFTILVDNANPVSIGANRIIGSLGINNPFTTGDALTGDFLNSEGSNYGHLRYTLPFGDNGLRIGLSTSAMSYHLVGSQFQAIDATGTAITNGIESTYPIIRTIALNLYLGINLDYRTFSNNNSQQGLINQYSVTDLSSSVYFSSIDHFNGSGTNSISLSLINGSTDLSGSVNQPAVAMTNNAQGNFTKIRYVANRNQSLTPGFTLFGNISGQISNRNLDASELFYLGGIGGVRAFPTNEGAGSQGQLGTMELRKSLPFNTILSLFYDYGHVQINVDNNFEGSTSHNSFDMKGDGLSLEWVPMPKLDLKMSWAKRIGINPNPTSKGTYQNGTSGSYEFWISSSLSY